MLCNIKNINYIMLYDIVSTRFSAVNKKNLNACYLILFRTF